jgi:CDP-glucose 4,6-dehydratase
MINIKNSYKNKNILITGHTGFKGSWLTLWLLLLGAKVFGISDKRQGPFSIFESLNNFKNLKSFFFDIRNKKKLNKLFQKQKFDYIFHLAAQPLVKRSIKKPLDTFEINIFGLINILEIIKELKYKIRVIIITTDKVYENDETNKKFNESDKLGGNDPYSASKAAKEIILNSYVKSFYSYSNNILICSARAGNVIGGGDWSDNRIIPDIMRSIIFKKKLILRNPLSTRPWQHVLETIYGYLLLGVKLNNKLSGSAFNFGPKLDENIPVIKIVKYMKKRGLNLNYKVIKEKKKIESRSLELDSNKSEKILKWKTRFSQTQAINFTIDWYTYFFQNKHDRDKIFEFSKKQILDYCEKF